MIEVTKNMEQFLKETVNIVCISSLAEELRGLNLDPTSQDTHSIMQKQIQDNENIVLSAQPIIDKVVLELNEFTPSEIIEFAKETKDTEKVYRYSVQYLKDIEEIRKRLRQN